MILGIVGYAYFILHWNSNQTEIGKMNETSFVSKNIENVSIGYKEIVSNKIENQIEKNNIEENIIIEISDEKQEVIENVENKQENQVIISPSTKVNSTSPNKSNNNSKIEESIKKQEELPKETVKQEELPKETVKQEEQTKQEEKKEEKAAENTKKEEQFEEKIQEQPKQENVNNEEQEKIVTPIENCSKGIHGMEAGNSGKWFKTKDEAIATYKTEINKWGEKWTNYEISTEEYRKNCPTGYEVWTCMFCNKWTINYYYD